MLILCLVGKAAVTLHRYMKIIAYADDVSIIAAHVSPSLCESLLSNFICKLCQWSFEKKISLSTTKSVILKLKGSPSSVPSVCMKDNLLPVVSEYKFLGIVISKNLHFHKHLNYKSLKNKLTCSFDCVNLTKHLQSLIGPRFILRLSFPLYPMGYFFGFGPLHFRRMRRDLYLFNTNAS